MTVIALDTLGVNADSDGRFVAKNGSAVDGLMQYQQKTVDFRPVRERVTVRQHLWQCAHLQAILRKLQNKATFFNFDVNDSVVFETPAPTKVQSSNNTSNKTSSSTSKSNTTTKTTTKPKTTKA